VIDRIAIAICVAICPVIAHAQSAVDGFDPGANDIVYAVAVQPDGKILVGGRFTMIGGGGTGSVSRNRLARLNVDGSVDTIFNPGANGDVLALAVQPDGKILVGGLFTGLGGGTGTITRNRIGRLNANGTVDTTFNPGANGPVEAIAVQIDGKILVGGNFAGLGGGTGMMPRANLGRLNADASGTVDAGFNPGANSVVRSVAVQLDGKIVVAGEFGMLGGGGSGTTPRNFVGRLTADGTLDASFNPGANNVVFAMVVQPNGGIVLGGSFTALGGGTGTTARNRIGRLTFSGGVDASFNPGANSTVYALSLQSDGKILVGGAFTGLGGGTGTTPKDFIGRLNADPAGTVDSSFSSGADGQVQAIAVQSDRKIVVGGAFTQLYSQIGLLPRSRIGRVYVDGSIDTAFDLGLDNFVWTTAVQADGKILIGGDFTSVGGAARSHIARVNPDGSVDSSFDPGADGEVLALVVQPDRKILVGGRFAHLGGGAGTTPRSFIGRLNPDGTIDADFDPGASDAVYSLALQPDGKILAAGLFERIGGGGMGLNTRRGVARLESDGTLDGSFDAGATDFVATVAVQPDGKILVGGFFTMLRGVTRQRIGRLNADSSLDGAFDPGANGLVKALALRPNGKIVVGGRFTMLGGGGTGTHARSYVGQLNADGTIDDGFQVGAALDVNTIAVQTDGAIVVGGDFYTLSDVATGVHMRNFIGRFTAAGSVDESFDPGANNIVKSLAMEQDGKILVGGFFTTLGGGGVGTTVRVALGRVTNTDAAPQQLAVTSLWHGLSWTRSGVGPELSRVVFDVSMDGGSIYTPLGDGSRIAGGWQLTNVTIPIIQNLRVRARGFFSTGEFNGSGSMLESVRLVGYYPFSDDPLVGGMSVVKADHIVELRTRIAALRARAGLSAYVYTDPTLTPGVTIIRSQHILELRAALAEVYATSGLPPPTYSTFPGAGVPIVAADITELRLAVIYIE
jgi:uncharacterized delta-60 repeat protein